MPDESDIRDRPAGRANDPALELTTADLAGRNPAPEENRQPEPSAREAEKAPLLAEAETEEFRAKWDRIQTSFVDEPRRAVEQADSLVAGAMKRLAEQFADERSRLEGQWDKGDDVSTEDLRIALQRYRSFFGRLLSV